MDNRAEDWENSGTIKLSHELANEQQHALSRQTGCPSRATSSDAAG